MNSGMKRLRVGRFAAVWMAMPALLIAQASSAQPWQGQELELPQETDADVDTQADVNLDVEEPQRPEPTDVPPLDRPRGLNTGDWTLSFGGHLVHDSPGRTSSFTRFDGEVRLGWNYAEHLRLTGIFGVKLMDPGMDEFNFRGRATYHVEVEDNPRFVPYLGGGLGFARLSNGRRETGPGFHGAGGLEFFLAPEQSPGTSVFVEYSPEFLFFGGDIGTSFRNTVIAGLSFHW